MAILTENDKTILKLAAKLLKLAEDEFENHGCNEYFLKDTPENRKIAQAAERATRGRFDGSNELCIIDGDICTYDDMLMAYCARHLKKLARAIE